jgi:bacterioferritin-associated ferredoxin
MYVCLCYGVTERRVRETIRGGARSAAEVSRRCYAGTGCGACRVVIREILESEAERRERLKLVELPESNAAAG